MNEYILMLFSQFLNSRGLSASEKNFGLYSNEFVEWIADMKEMSREYACFIESLGCNLEYDEVFELDKGVHDSIITDPEHQISPYIIGVELYRRFVNRAINDDLSDFYYPGTNICYITQNPYTQFHTNTILQAHKKENPIFLGVYGSVHDVDKLAKLESLEEIERDVDGLEMEYELVDGIYLGVLKPKYLIKERIKSLSR